MKRHHWFGLGNRGDVVERVNGGIAPLCSGAGLFGGAEGNLVDGIVVGRHGIGDDIWFGYGWSFDNAAIDEVLDSMAKAHAFVGGVPVLLVKLAPLIWTVPMRGRISDMDRSWLGYVAQG